MNKSVDHAARLHCDLPPSSSDKWMNCRGWFKATAEFRKLPESSNPAADEGTLAHECFEQHLQWIFSSEALGVPLYKNELAKGQMPDHLMEMADWVIEQDNVPYLEKRVDFGAALGGYVNLEGTADLIFWDNDTKCLTVADLKYGMMVVEPEENTQLLLYALGAAHTLEIPREEIKTYRGVILQPRAFHSRGPVREWQVPWVEVEKFAVRAEQAIADNYGSGQRVSGDWCRKWCRALGSCETAAKAARRIWKDNPL